MGKKYVDDTPRRLDEGLVDESGEKPDTPFPGLIPSFSWQLGLIIVATGATLGGVVLLSPTLQDAMGKHFDVVTNILLFSIPFVSVVFTYFHIWLALWMTFYPIEFKGIYQLKNSKTWANVGLPGWQGIVPSKAEKMARTAVKLMTTKLINIKELFGKVEPLRVAAELGPMLNTNTREIVDAIASKSNPTLWAMVPNGMKEELCRKIIEDAPPIIEKMMDDIRNNIEDVIDIEEMVVEQGKKRPELLNQMFITCGYSELCFIRNSGATMGFIFGMIQLAIFVAFDIGNYDKETGEAKGSDLVLRLICFPVIGLLVGSLTNAIALAAIFKPVDPIYICGVKIQGLFLQHQKEVAREYAKIAARDFLNPQNIAEAFVKGRFADVLVSLIYGHIEAAVDAQFGKLQPIVRVTMGSSEYDAMRDEFAKKVVELIPVSVEHLQSYVMEALEVQTTLETSVGNLPSKDFESLLHPVFQEDEWKLVLLGGVLGVLIGFVQIKLI